jgi:hypothetical protein
METSDSLCDEQYISKLEVQQLSYSRITPSEVKMTFTQFKDLLFFSTVDLYLLVIFFVDTKTLQDDERIFSLSFLGAVTFELLFVKRLYRFIFKQDEKNEL